MSSELPPTTPSSTSSTPAPLFQYRGHDLLDLLKGARNYNRWLTDQVIGAKPAKAREIADLGAGRGTFAEMLRDRGLDVTCIEPDASNQSILQQLGFQVRSTITDCADASLDYVYTLNVLEHVPDDELLLQQVFSRLAKGGVLFIFVPAFPVLWSTLDDYVEQQRRYRRKGMIKMLERSGFAVEKAQYADSLAFSQRCFSDVRSARRSPRVAFLCTTASCFR